MDTTEMMMTDKLNSGLIESMKEKIPEGANLANLLMDILYIGKEAVYCSGSISCIMPIRSRRITR